MARVAWLVVPLLLWLSTTGAVLDDVPRSSPGEELSGGGTTVFKQDHSAFGHALGNLQRSRWLPMRAGKRLFENPWYAPSAESATAPRLGLGPLANASSCVDCHFRDGRGGPPPNVTSKPAPPPLIVRLARNQGEPDPRYGSQLNDRGYGLPPEGQLNQQPEEHVITTASGEQFRLMHSRVEVSQLSRGPLHADSRASSRIPPTLIGLGLLEAVPAGTLEQLADPRDLDGDGISGRVQKVATSSGYAVGRFGWKAGQPDLKSQIARAFHEDMGITSSRHPAPNCPAKDELCQRLAGDRIELTDAQLDRVTLYTQLLAPPARRDWQEPEVLQGRELFTTLGCAACHTPQLQTASIEADPGVLPELADQTIRPYTDLLLHDMGPDLADEVAEHDAQAAEWRTPPLWGLGLMQRVNGHLYLLHDGRARTLTDAILWHGGEAAKTRDRFVELPEQDQQALLRFLNSL